MHNISYSICKYEYLSCKYRHRTVFEMKLNYVFRYTASFKPIKLFDIDTEFHID